MNRLESTIHIYNIHMNINDFSFFLKKNIIVESLTLFVLC